jgi:predicted RNA-binding protein with PUA-like domain
MAHWLLKSEPGEWSWEDQVRSGDAGDMWDGVRNHQAANNLKAMHKGDLGFFYHSGKAREIVGIVEVIGEQRPDPTDPSGRFVVVDVRAKAPFPRPVSLKEIKADPALAEMALVRHSRLSVMPVTAEHWRRICKMGGT